MASKNGRNIKVATIVAIVLAVGAAIWRQATSQAKQGVRIEDNSEQIEDNKANIDANFAADHQRALTDVAVIKDLEVLKKAALNREYDDAIQESILDDILTELRQSPR